MACELRGARMFPAGVSVRSVEDPRELPQFVGEGARLLVGCRRRRDVPDSGVRSLSRKKA